MSRSGVRGFSLTEALLALLIGSLVLSSALLMLLLHLQQMTRQREPHRAQQEVIWLMARWQQAMVLAGQVAANKAQGRASGTRHAMHRCKNHLQIGIKESKKSQKKPDG